MNNKNSFFKNIFTLTWGTATAQGVAILLQPFLRRFFSPEDFGAFSIYTSLASIFVIIGSLRFELSIVPQKEKKDAEGMLNVSIFSSAIVAIILFISLFFSYDWLREKLDFPVSKIWWLFLFPVSVFLQSVYQAFSYYLIRSKDFSANAKNKFFRRVSEGFIHLGGGVLHLPGALVNGELIGNLINCITGYYQIRRNGFKRVTLNLTETIFYAKKNYKYPLYNSLPAFLNNLSLLLPVFIVNKNFDVESVGQFDLARMIFVIPSALVSQSISQVLFQKVAEAKNNNYKLLPFFKKLSLGLFATSFVLFVLLWFFGVDFIQFVFGKKWLLAGELTRILSISFSISFISSTLSTSLIALGRIKLWSVWQLFYFLLIFFLYIQTWTSIITFIWYFVFINTIAYLIYYLFIYYSIVNNDKKIIVF